MTNEEIDAALAVPPPRAALLYLLRQVEGLVVALVELIRDGAELICDGCHGLSYEL